MNKQMDLRVVKTLGNIRESFFELLKKKTISEITVKEICDGAKCSRNTFYTYYPYKEALHEQVLDECIGSVQHGFRFSDRLPGESDKDYIDRGIHYAVMAMNDSREILAVVLASDSTNTFCCRLTNAIRESMLEGSARMSPNGTATDTYQLIARYCSSGIVGFLLGWLEDTSMSVAEAENVLRDLHSVPFAVGHKYLEEYEKTNPMS